VNGWGRSDGIVLAIVVLVSLCRSRIQSDGCGGRRMFERTNGRVQYVAFM
jgi:hypothetical protein